MKKTLLPSRTSSSTCCCSSDSAGLTAWLLLHGSMLLLQPPGACQCRGVQRWAWASGALGAARRRRQGRQVAPGGGSNQVEQPGMLRQ